MKEWKRYRTHLAVDHGAACGVVNPRRLAGPRNRVDCKSCLRSKAWASQPPNEMAMDRIVRHQGIRESRAVRYHASAGAFLYVGPLVDAIDLVLENRWPWFDLSPEGQWLVALCADPECYTFDEWGFGPTAELAWRYAIAASLTATDELYLVALMEGATS